MDRLRIVLGTARDIDLAKALGVKKNTVSGWRSRNSKPFEICEQVAQDRGISLDWLLTGEGKMLREPTGPAGVCSPASSADDRVAPYLVTDAPGQPPADSLAPRLAALTALLAALDPEHSDAILADALSRATDAQRLAELERAVESMPKPRPKKRA